MIIIEGADGSGKSTLKEQLKKDLNLIDMSLTKVDDIVERQWRAMIDPRSSIDCITDRSFFISELFYSKLLRGYKVPKTLWPLLHKVYEGHLIIFCTGQGEEIRKDYDSDEEVWQKTQQTKSLARDFYKELAEDFKSSLTYDFTKDTYDFLKSQVVQYMNSFYVKLR